MKSLVIRRSVLFAATAFTAFLFLPGVHSVFADTKVKQGTTMRVNPGSTVFEYGSAAATSGGFINNQGTIIIKGDLVNENTTLTNLGTGLFEFSGSSAQVISSPNEFGSVRIANTGGGVSIDLYDQVINTGLKMKNGLLTLETYHLLLGPSATDSGGSSGSFVVATGTGEFRKEFSGTKSFTYPVGDNTGTPDYSPVTVDFTAGTFPAGNYLGINLKNERDPLLSTANYLNRYWTLNNNGISAFSCDLTFGFVDGDVVGTKTDMYCLQTILALTLYDIYSSGNLLTGTVTDFGRFTGSNVIDISPTITVEPSVMHGLTYFNTIIQVTELNFGNTNGTITILLTKDSRWDLNGGYNPSATVIGTTPVNNSDWTYDDTDPVYHIFTTNTVITKGSFLNFGFNAVFNAPGTMGTYTITSQMTSFSGGEYRIDNNVDAEGINFFIN